MTLERVCSLTSRSQELDHSPQASKELCQVVKDSVEQPKIDWSNPPPELVEAWRISSWGLGGYKSFWQLSSMLGAKCNLPEVALVF